MIFTPPTLCPLTPESDVKKYFLKYFSLSAPICTLSVKFQLSETIWWWIEPCGEAPFIVRPTHPGPATGWGRGRGGGGAAGEGGASFVLGPSVDHLQYLSQLG